MKSEKILVIGACGQIGTELTITLREKHGWQNVIAADLKLASEDLQQRGPYVRIDVLNKVMTSRIIARAGITQIYHLAAMLSASGERTPEKAWDINMQGLLNVLDAARQSKIPKIFWPSSIAVFDKTGAINPSTVYGISKAAGEYWCQYYFEKYGMDIRSLRYPGLISSTAMPGGGTTDYAVEIFHEAVQSGCYQCFLSEETRLPMLYMPDAIRATLELMDAPKEKITIRKAYSLGGMSFTPGELASEISNHIPELSVSYTPDFRQAIAENWPNHIDDHRARYDWNWKPKYDLKTMTSDMLQNLALPVL